MIQELKPTDSDQFMQYFTTILRKIDNGDIPLNSLSL